MLPVILVISALSLFACILIACNLNDNTNIGRYKLITLSNKNKNKNHIMNKKSKRINTIIFFILLRL